MHEWPEGPGGRGSSEVKTGNRRFKGCMELRESVDGLDFFRDGAGEKRIAAYVDAVSSTQQDVVGDANGGIVQSEMNGLALD